MLKKKKTNFYFSRKFAKIKEFRIKGSYYDYSSTFFNNSALDSGNLSSTEKPISDKWNGFCDFRLRNNFYLEN